MRLRTRGGDDLEGDRAAAQDAPGGDVVFEAHQNHLIALSRLPGAPRTPVADGPQ